MTERRWLLWLTGAMAMGCAFAVGDSPYWPMVFGVLAGAAFAASFGGKP